LAPADGVRPSASAPAALAAAQPLYSLHQTSSGAASGAAASGAATGAASGAVSGAAASGAAASGATASGAAASGGVSLMAKPRSLQWLEELERGEWTHRSPTSAASYLCER
jgi:hypothetical protein